jgi:hypothetical protein
MWMRLAPPRAIFSTDPNRNEETVMSTALPLCTALALIPLAAGCVVEDPHGSARAKARAEALEGRAADGADLCELWGFYGDGECDAFCPSPDPDCPVCLALPVCDPGETAHERVEECPADASCREVTLCGTTIWCEAPAFCLAVPACEPGETAHPRLEDCPIGVTCREETVCGSTIWCAGGALCLAVPTCEEGETAHANVSECPADASCREVTVCGSTNWCSSTDAPACAGENPAGCIASGCEAGFVCDTTAGTAPSACACDPENGTWICTADLNGGICVLEEA